MIRGSSLTFADLKLRLSELVVLSERESASNPVNIAPTDPNTNDRLGRAINDGANEFATATKIGTNGQPVRIEWAWLWDRFDSFELSSEGTAKYSLDANPRRYFLPGAASIPKNDLLWSDGTTAGTMTAATFDQVLEEELRNPTRTGSPIYWGAEYRASMGGIELRVFPAPERTYYLNLRVRIGVPPLVNDSDRGIWPDVHSRTVLAYALRCFHRGDKAPDSPAHQFAESMCRERLLASIAANGDFLPDSAPNPKSFARTEGRAFQMRNNGEVILQGVSYP